MTSTASEVRRSEYTRCAPFTALIRPKAECGLPFDQTAVILMRAEGEHQDDYAADQKTNIRGFSIRRRRFGRSLT